jgi:hypothetical protein
VTPVTSATSSWRPARCPLLREDFASHAAATIWMESIVARKARVSPTGPRQAWPEDRLRRHPPLFRR